MSLVPGPVVAPAPVAADPNAAARRDYELAERVGTKEAWDSFVAAHPSGFYTDLAKAQRNKLAAETARVAAADTKMHAGVQGKRAIGVDAIRTWPNVVSGDFGIGTGMGSQDQRSPSVFGKILRKP